MAKEIYRIRFLNSDKIYELYAKHVYQAEIFGFIAIEDFVFGKNTSVVIDPGEERLKNEFSDVKKTFVPMHAILRIDQVKKQGVAKVIQAQGNVSTFPSPIYTPKSDRDRSS